MPSTLIDKILYLVELATGRSLPFKQRGITIDRLLIEVVLEILSEAQAQTLPQNCRNDSRDRTPDGLDRRIKEKLNSDLRTANIISDVLAEAGIVKVVKVINPETGREVKGTRLEDEQNWRKPVVSQVRARSLAASQVKKDSITGSNVRSKPKQTVGRLEYLSNPYVQAFSSWLLHKLDQPGSFTYSYYLKKAGFQWSCSSIYDTYEKRSHRDVLFGFSSGRSCHFLVSSDFTAISNSYKTPL